MARPRDPTVEKAMARLRRAGLAHQAAVEELIELGVIRSCKVVADLGEALAADYYGVELDLKGRLGQGYDLINRDGKRVEVKALRDSPFDRRTRIGPMKKPYDLLLAIRLGQDYVPIEAIEVPPKVVEQFYPRGKTVSWTKKLWRSSAATSPSIPATRSSSHRSVRGPGARRSS
jgi:hypothetical protein